MRLWTVPAVLAALLSAAAAHACFLKFCCRPAPAPAAAEVSATSGGYGASYLIIELVDGYPVDMSQDPNVQGDVNPNHDVDVVVYADYDTGIHSENIDLVLTDLGPRSGPAAALAKGQKKHHKYKWKVLRYSLTPAGAAATTVRFWEVHFTLPYDPTPELKPNEKYQLQAFYPSETAPTVKSNPVTFWTSP